MISRTLSSLAALSIASASAAYMATVMALRRSAGASRIDQDAARRCSTSTCSFIGRPLPESDDRVMPAAMGSQTSEAVRTKS